MTPRDLRRRCVIGPTAGLAFSVVAPRGTSGLRRTFVWLVCLTAFLGTQRTRGDDVAPLGRFDLAPYRVTVRATFALDPSVTPTLRRSVVSSLTARIGQTFGAAWSLQPADRPSVAEDDTLDPANESGLDRLTYAAIAEKIGAVPCDKAYLLVVRPKGPGWLIAGREWDRTLQSLGPVLTSTTVDRRAISDAAVDLLERLYSPLLIVNDADRDSKTVTLTVRAGSIPSGDPRWAPLKKGAIFVPVFRFLDSRGNVRKIQPVPWTYLVLDEIKEGIAKCTLASSYRAPLAANMRRRVDAVAVLLRPELPATHLKLVVGKGTHRPLPGLFVDLQSMPADQADKAAGPPERQELLSDRSGAVTIKVDPRQPLRLLEVRSGSAILARRPYVPGVDAEATLELVDDEIRLNTQRDIDLLRVQLIETVARRAALIARTRASLKTSDAAVTQGLLAEIQRLPVADSYLAKLNEIRVLSLEEASRRKDRVSERRIEDLCEKTRALIEQYLPEDRLQTLREEIATALSESQAAAAAAAAAAKKPATTFPPLTEPRPKTKAKAKAKPAAAQPASGI
jgi:hypothetical protein